MVCRYIQCTCTYSIYQGYIQCTCTYSIYQGYIQCTCTYSIYQRAGNKPTTSGEQYRH